MQADSTAPKPTFDYLITRMKASATGWELNVLNAVAKWNPHKINPFNKDLLYLIARRHLTHYERQMLLHLMRKEDD